MLPYIIIILLPIMIAYVRNKGIVRIGVGIDEDKRNYEISCFMIIFCALLMFRGAKCGSDTEWYMSAVHYYGQHSLGELISHGETEIGYTIISKLCWIIVQNTRVVIIVTSLITVVPLWYFYKKEAEFPILTIALFLTVSSFSMYFSGIRQSLAMAFAIPAWYMAKNKKWVKFLIVIAIAILFHNSAFILLAIYPLYHLKITTKWLYFVVPSMIAVYVFNGTIFKFLLQFLWDDYNTTDATGATTVLILLVIFAVYSYLITEDWKIDKDLIGLRNILLFAILIQCFAPVHPLAMRMNYYFLPFIPILIPKIANRAKPQFKNVANVSVIVMTLFFIVYFYYRLLGSDPLNIYPYVSFLSSEYHPG